MNAVKIYIVSASIIIFSGTLSAQSFTNSNFYIGVGTGVSSYLGGYFGNAYSMKVLSDYYDDDYYDDYYYDDYSGYYNNTTIWSPIQIEISGGYNLNENLSAEFSSTFLFAFNGSIDPEFVTGSNRRGDYIDRNSRSLLYAVPVSAALNIHSSGDDGSGVFFKFGPAFQYTSEEYDRVREYYEYDEYYSYSEFFYLYTVSKSEWLPGFTVSTGIQFALSEYTTSYTELAYSYFKISGNNSTALALDRAIEAQLFSLNTKVYFNF